MSETIEVKKQRVWEIDAFRGLMILFVVWDHFMWDVLFVGENYHTALFKWLDSLAYKYSYGSLRFATHDAFVMLFVLTSGISSSFSRNNLWRGLRMALWAVIFTVVTKTVEAVADSMGYNLGVEINFNVIHVIALSVLIWAGLEKLQQLCKKPWQKNVFGIVMFVLTVAVLATGYTIQNVADGFLSAGSAPKVANWLKNDNRFWFFLYDHGSYASGFYNYSPGDYLAFIPAFGWFLVGVFLGQFIYKDKTTLFPTVNEKWVKPLTFCGRHSLWVYFISQVVMLGLVALFSSVLGWL